MKLKPIVFIVLAVVILGGLFVILKPKNSGSVTSNEKIFELEVKDRKLVSSEETLQVTEGNHVTILITVDEDEELHLHGYDKSIELEKGKEGKLTFTAELTGRFPYELEKSKTELGTLEVAPK